MKFPYRRITREQYERAMQAMPDRICEEDVQSLIASILVSYGFENPIEVLAKTAMMITEELRRPEAEATHEGTGAIN